MNIFCLNILIVLNILFELNFFFAIIYILEQEYINSFEIVERNNNYNRQRHSLNIEYIDNLQITANRNEIKYVIARVPRTENEVEIKNDFEIIGRNKEYLEMEQIDKISFQEKI